MIFVHSPVLYVDSTGVKEWIVHSIFKTTKFLVSKAPYIFSLDKKMLCRALFDFFVLLHHNYLNLIFVQSKIKTKTSIQLNGR